MTISSTTRKAGPFNGNGVTTSFPFTFKVFTKSDLEVVRTMPSGIEKTLVLNSDYSVALNGDQDANPGGTITYPVSGTPLPTGWRLTAIGTLDNIQPTDITNGGGFYPQVIENALDRVTMLIQQLDEEVDRTIRIAVSDDSTEGLELPAQDGRATRILGFDADGNFTTYERATATVQTTYRQFTATAGQTSFTLPNSYTPGANSLYVWMNGAKLISGVDFSETTSTSFTLTNGAQAGDTIEAIAGVPLASGTVADSSQVTYTPAGAGAVGRTAQAKMRETVSVKDFGAVGDGVTNDTAAMLAARDYAETTKALVFVHAGTYILQPGTDLSADNTEWHFAPGAILKLWDTQATTSFITFSNPVNQRVFGLRVDANRAKQNAASFGRDNCAVLVVDGTNCIFEHPEIISSPAKGFAVVSTASGYNRDITINDFKGADCGDQVLLVDGNNKQGFFKNIIINGVRIGATSHAGVALNDGAHNIALSNVISDIQNSAHDAVSVRDSFDIQMNNVRGNRGRNGVQIERLNGFTGRIEMNNVIGDKNAANGVLFFGAENITGGVVVGRNNVDAGINIAQTGANPSYRSKNISIAAPVAYDDQGVRTQGYGVLVNGVDGCRLGNVRAYNNKTKDFYINRDVTSDVQADVVRKATGSTGAIAASSESAVSLNWATPFDDAGIDIESISVAVGTASRALVVGHVMAVSATAVQVLILNLGAGSMTGDLTVIGRRRV